ncbi:hypothetical protein Tco_1307111 [Tanacetum coccineum]
MYLASSEESISAFLLVERGNRQVPIYFMSWTLQGAELGYPELEKLILALPKKSGRTAKWAIELGEHDIEFRGRNSVKGQLLADFRAETLTESKEKEYKETIDEEEEPENMWKLYTDGASSSDGSRPASDKAIPKENKGSPQRLPQLFHGVCSARLEQKRECSKQTGFDDLLKTGQRSFGGSPTRKVNYTKRSGRHHKRRRTCTSQEHHSGDTSRILWNAYMITINVFIIPKQHAASSVKQTRIVKGMERRPGKTSPRIDG